MKRSAFYALACLLFISGCWSRVNIPSNVTFNSTTTLWSWSGIWAGDGASMHLVQEGNRVHGNGTNPLGQPFQLEGEISGNQMVGSVTKKNAGSGYFSEYGGVVAGPSEETMTFILSMSDDGKYAKSSARGGYGYSNDTSWERTSPVRSLSGEVMTIPVPQPPMTVVSPSTPEIKQSFQTLSSPIKVDEARTALLIGNANYPQNQLRTPRQDARAMSATLQGYSGPRFPDNQLRGYPVTKGIEDERKETQAIQ